MKRLLAVRPAEPEDAFALVPRPEDAAEIQQYGFLNPAVALMDSLELSRSAWAATDAGGLVALFGHSEDDLGVHPWMVCSRAVKRHPRPLLGLSRLAVDGWRSLGVPVWNYISKQAHTNRRFVEHLGFVIEPLPHHPRFDRFYLP